MSSHSLIHAFKWSLASEIAAKAIQPVVLIVLARLLTPEDFGVMSAALMVIAFSQIFWEAGMGKALIQRQTDIQIAANVAFWVNLGLGIIVGTLLYTTAAPIAHFIFHDSRVTDVLRAMTLQVFLGALGSVHIALLQKDMGFKKLFWVRIATVSLPAFASIPLAWNGMGYWALVAGALVGQAAQVTLLWHMSSWRPTKSFDRIIAMEMASFGAWAGTTGLLAWFYIWADSLTVGMYLGSHEMGLYQTGNQFATMIFSVIFGPLVPVFYSHLSKIGQDRDRMYRASLRVINAIAIITVPVGMMVFSLAHPLTVVLFGQKWLGLELVIGVMTLLHGFTWVMGLNGELYRAIGKPAYETIVSAAPVPVYLGSYLLSIQYGLEAFVWTRFALGVGAIVFHLLILRIVLSISIAPVVRFLLRITLIAAGPALTIRFFLTSYQLNAWWQLVAGGTLGLVLTGALLFLVERNRIIKDWWLILRREA